MIGRSILLIRHCAATGQNPGAPLSDAGIQQAQILAQFISDHPIDHIATSEYLRARQTIEPFSSQSGLRIHLDARLNERTLSTEPIENWQQIVRSSFDDYDLCATGGESARQVLTRAWAALDEVFDADHAMPLVVTHGNLIALVLHSLDSTFGFQGWKSLTNPDVYVLRKSELGRVDFNRLWA